MKRRTVHLMFGAAAAVCAALAGYEGFRLREAVRVNEAIAAASNASGIAIGGGSRAERAAPGSGAADSGAAGTGVAGSGVTDSGAAAIGVADSTGAHRTAAGSGAGVSASHGAGRDDAALDALGSALPEARFAHAVALAKRGDYEGALKQYKVLSRGSRADLATDALYNAGNLQLREALKEGREAAVRALPLIELAKQSYRGVLRRDPQRWDARYNLERALWLAPELDEVLSETITRDAENRVMSTLQSTRADLP